MRSSLAISAGLDFFGPRLFGYMGMMTLCPPNNEDWTAALEDILRFD